VLILTEDLQLLLGSLCVQERHEVLALVGWLLLLCFGFLLVSNAELEGLFTYSSM